MAPGKGSGSKGKQPDAAASKKKKKKAASAPEETPLIGGRVLWAAGVIFLLIVPTQCIRGQRWDPFQPLEQKPAKTGSWQPGGEYDVTVTLVTADYQRLGCASDAEVGAHHCTNKANGKPWPRDPKAPLDDNREGVIQPYCTWPGNRMMLISSLWATPELAMRLHKEPPKGRDVKTLARFNASCRVKALERRGDIRVRWDEKQRFVRAKPSCGADSTSKGPIWVVEAKSCTIEGVQ